MGHPSGRAKGRVTRASVQFRGHDSPLLRLKLPVSGFLGAPIFAGCTVGGSAEDLALHLGTLLSEGPSLRLTYRPVAAGSSLPASATAALAVAPLLSSETHAGGAQGRTVAANGPGASSAAATVGISSGGQAVEAEGDAQSSPGSLLAVLKAGLGRRGAASGAALSLRLEVDLLRPAASRLVFKVQPCFGDASIRRFPTSGLPSACSISRTRVPAGATAPGAPPQGIPANSGLAADHVSSISEQPGHASGLQAVAAKSPSALNGFRALPHTQSSPTPLASSPSSCASLPTRATLAFSAPLADAGGSATSAGVSAPSEGALVQEAAAQGSHTAAAATDQGSWLQGVGVGQIGRWVQRKRQEQGWDVAMHSTVPVGSAGLLRARWRLHLPGEPLHLPLSLGEASFGGGGRPRSGMAGGSRVGEVASMQDASGVATSLSPQADSDVAGVTLTGCPVLLLDKLSLVLYERARRAARHSVPAASQASAGTRPGLAGGPHWAGSSLAPGTLVPAGCACQGSSLAGALGGSHDGGSAPGGQKQGGADGSPGVPLARGEGRGAGVDKAPFGSGQKSAEPTSSGGGWRLWGGQKKKGGGAQPQERGQGEKGKGQAPSSVDLQGSREGWGQAQGSQGSQGSGRSSSAGAGGTRDGGFLGLQEEPWETVHPHPGVDSRKEGRKGARLAQAGTDSGRGGAVKGSSASGGGDVSEALRLAILHAQQQ